MFAMRFRGFAMIVACKIASLKNKMARIAMHMFTTLLKEAILDEWNGEFFILQHNLPSQKVFAEIAIQSELYTAVSS